MDSGATTFCMRRFLARMGPEPISLRGNVVFALAGDRFRERPCRCSGCWDFERYAERLLGAGDTAGAAQGAARA